jgi:putative DNA primase/helicase
MRKALDGVWEHPAARVEDTPSLPQVEVLLGRLEGVRRAGPELLDGPLPGPS